MATRVIILAAGKGTRMGADVPKPLVEVAGRPMVEHLLDNVRDSGIDEQPVLIVAPDSIEQFRNFCSDEHCEYVVQEEQLGTGHATQVAQPACGGAETIVVLYGDHPFISSELLQKLEHSHQESDAVIMMMTTKVPNFKKEYAGFERWGRIIRDGSGRIASIREAKDASEEELAINELNPAIYAFDADWLWENLSLLKNTNASEEYYLTDLVEIAIESGLDVLTIQAKPFEVVGINTPEELERAEEYFA